MHDDVFLSMDSFDGLVRWIYLTDKMIHGFFKSIVFEFLKICCGSAESVTTRRCLSFDGLKYIYNLLTNLRMKYTNEMNNVLQI